MSSAVKNVAHALRSIYLTFGHWGVPAALDISNIRTLKVKERCVSRTVVASDDMTLKNLGMLALNVWKRMALTEEAHYLH
jgi:hypothetical protein